MHLPDTMWKKRSQIQKKDIPYQSTRHKVQELTDLIDSDRFQKSGYCWEGVLLGGSRRERSRKRPSSVWVLVNTYILL